MKKPWLRLPVATAHQPWLAGLSENSFGTGRPDPFTPAPPRPVQFGLLHWSDVIHFKKEGGNWEVGNTLVNKRWTGAQPVNCTAGCREINKRG